VLADPGTHMHMTTGSRALCSTLRSPGAWSPTHMRPMFTVHAGEFLVGQYIEGKLMKNVWMPTKDVGVDLLVTNAANTRAVTLQVKFSRDFLPKAGTVRADAAKAVRLRSRTSCGRFGFSDRFGRLAPRVSTRREYPSLSCPPASAAVGTCLK
jgi:hypothetical protein